LQARSDEEETNFPEHLFTVPGAGWCGCWWLLVGQHPATSAVIASKEGVLQERWCELARLHPAA